MQRLNITSGSRTYRLPSPTRPAPKARPVYQTREEEAEEEEGDDIAPTQTLRDGVAEDKGFYISFEEAPKRPKPPLRTRKMAQRKVKMKAFCEFLNKTPQLDSIDLIRYYQQLPD